MLPDAPVAEEVTRAPRETILEESTTAVTAESDALTPDAVEAGEVVVPDTSADDPLVRQQEEAARAQAGRIGGTADSATADVEPEMQPVVEGSGDAEETFEATEDEGR